jgi:hypothetical protein
MGHLAREMVKKKNGPKMTYAEFASKGGKARAEKLTPEQRSASARKAARARWAKRKREENRRDEYDNQR